MGGPGRRPRPGLDGGIDWHIAALPSVPARTPPAGTAGEHDGAACGFLPCRSPAALAGALRREFASRADPARAAAMAAYMRGRFSFLGLPTPLRRRLAAPLVKAWAGPPLAAAQALWTEPEREFQYVACDLLHSHNRRLAVTDFAGILALAADKSWWDTVDSLAKRVGDLARRYPALIARLDRLIDDDNFWLRRVALLHQLGWKAATDEARLFDYCRRRAGDPEFFLQKAIGWALRDYAWSAPEAVRGFLAAEGERLSPLSRREAGKNL